jgi:glucokinase
MSTPRAPGFVLAVDFGGTKVEAALVDHRGVVLAASKSREPTGGTATSDSLVLSVQKVVARAITALPTDGTLLGVGIGSAGPLAGGALVSPLNVPAWRDYPLRELIRSLVPDVPIELRIDGICIAIAEHWVGAAQKSKNSLGMIVSTGIGGGLILDGKAFSGPTGNAGHIGHIEVGGFDDACLCGGVGCLEAVASGPKTVAWAIRQGWTGATGEDLAASYETGDPIAAAAVERSGRAIGQALASATALADLDLVAIGGGFSNVTPDLFRFIREAIAERAEFRFVTKVKIVPSALSGDGPLIGAAALIHRSEFLG